MARSRRCSALALGAADTLVKPGMGAFASEFGAVLEDRLARLLHDASAEPMRAVPVAPRLAEPTST